MWVQTNRSGYKIICNYILQYYTRINNFIDFKFSAGSNLFYYNYSNLRDNIDSSIILIVVVTKQIFSMDFTHEM